MTGEQLIQHCFNEHAKDIGGIQFSFEEYKAFWTSHAPGANYEMKNRDGSIVVCRVAYYPLPYYKDLRALIEINKVDWTDFPEVPIRFLKTKPAL